MTQIKHFPGRTLLHRLDPRTKLLLLFLFIFIEVAFRDVRILLVPFLVSLLLYLSARIPFREVKSTWRFILIVIVVITSLNTLFTLAGTSVQQPHVVARFWILTVTLEGTFLALGAIMRLLSLVIVSLAVVMTTDPALYAPALARLGIPYKGAMVFDLALRYVPTYTIELQTTMNAQMARGYKPKVKAGILAGIVNTVPLLLPVSIGAMLSIYDVADAMELRAFGIKKERTWYRTLRFTRVDYVTLFFLALFLLVSFYLRLRFPSYWIPD